jgi:hypothetical protein
VKQIASDPTKVSEIIELFFRDNLFEMLCKETNLYYFQNQGKYYRSFKGLKWVNVSVKKLKKELNSVALDHKRTVPTERPPPLGEVSANFCG